MMLARPTASPPRGGPPHRRRVVADEGAPNETRRNIVAKAVLGALTERRPLSGVFLRCL